MSGASEVVHWISDAPTSLHGNGAASFDRTTRNASEVTCRLCLHLLCDCSLSHPLKAHGGDPARCRMHGDHQPSPGDTP